MAFYTCILFDNEQKNLPEYYHVSIGNYMDRSWKGWNGILADGRAVIQLPEKEMELIINIYYEGNWLEYSSWLIRATVRAGNIYSIAEKTQEKKQNDESSFVHQMTTTAISLVRRISQEISPSERRYQYERFYLKFETHLSSNQEKDYYNYKNNVKQETKAVPPKPELTEEQKKEEEEKRKRKAEKRKRRKERRKLEKQAFEQIRKNDESKLK